MSAAIDWSHALLATEERALFRRLSVFTGGFELAAAEEVGAQPDGDAPRSAGEVLSPLLRLIDKSMVMAVRSPSGRTRYRLLETIREYAGQRLAEAGETAAAGDRHAGWYARLAETMSGYGGADHELLLARLDAELGNLRAALGWCLQDGRAPERALSIIAPLWWYWWLRGLGEEAQAWLARCLAAVDAAPSPARGLALRAAASLARNSARHAEARRLGEECLATYRALGDGTGVAAALNSLCITLHAEGDYEAALGFALESLETAREARNQRGVAISLSNMGNILRCLDRAQEAEDAVRSGLQAFREIGDRRGEAAALNCLAILARRVGDLTLARGASLESLALYQGLDLPEGQLDTLETIASVEVAEGSPAGALRLVAVADRERRRLGAAALTRDEHETHEATLAAARAALTQAAQATALDEARLTRLEDAVAGLVAGATAPPDAAAAGRPAGLTLSHRPPAARSPESLASG
jgi:tetratricopeptide (TPR) repeat protein